MATRHTLIGKEKLEASEIENRIIEGESLVRAKLAGDADYERLRLNRGINKVKAYRFRIVAEFVSLSRKGIFNEEYIKRTHWSTLVTLASKPEDIKEHTMLLHLIHYGMLREDKGLPVSIYSLPSDSTTVDYVRRNKDKNYIRAMFANAQHEAGVLLNEEEKTWLSLPWEPLVIEKQKKIATIASSIADEIEESFNFEQDDTTYPVKMDLSFVEPGRESAVLNLFTAQQANGSSEDIKNIIQEQLERYFGITAPDAEEMKKLQEENQMLRDRLYDVLQEIRTIHNTIADAGTASQLFIETAQKLDLQKLKNTISDTLNK